MPATERLAEAVQQIFSRRLGIEVDSATTDLFASGLMDSLVFVNLLLHLEAEFGLSIPLERIELEQFGTVERIAAFVVRERRAQDVDGRLLSRVG